MKKVAILFTILILVGSISFGQDIPPGPSAGSKGMLFSFSGLSNLGAGTYQGGFGAKLYLSDYMAVRGMVQLALLSTKTPPNAPAGWQTADATTSDNTFGVGGAIELHFTKSRISPYIGAGIMFSTESTESKTSDAAPAGVTLIQTTTKNANGSTSIGIGALLGVEYYVTNGVSLSAEYQLGFTSTSLKDVEVSTPGSPTVTTKQGSSSAIGIANSGLLTLAVYF
ncbi:MAG: outer membrane beta-barrel protein [Bacteroidota bacterium]|jgi:opacity protein-like surface antigen